LQRLILREDKGEVRATQKLESLRARQWAMDLHDRSKSCGRDLILELASVPRFHWTGDMESQLLCGLRPLAQQPTHRITHG
jgi:hypothetical protein